MEKKNTGERGKKKSTEQKIGVIWSRYLTGENAFFCEMSVIAEWVFKSLSLFFPLPPNPPSLLLSHLLSLPLPLSFFLPPPSFPLSLTFSSFPLPLSLPALSLTLSLPHPFSPSLFSGIDTETFYFFISIESHQQLDLILMCVIKSIFVRHCRFLKRLFSRKSASICQSGLSRYGAWLLKHSSRRSFFPVEEAPHDSHLYTAHTHGPVW